MAWSWAEAWSLALAFLRDSCPSIHLQAAQDPSGLGQRAGEEGRQSLVKGAGVWLRAPLLSGVLKALKPRQEEVGL